MHSGANGHEIEISQHQVCVFLFRPFVIVSSVNGVDKHHSPSLNYVEESSNEWIGMDLYDIAERGMVDRCLSQFISISVHVSVMCHVDGWMQTTVHSHMFDGTLDESGCQY